MKRIFRICVFALLLIFIFVSAIACNEAGTDSKDLESKIDESNVRISELEEIINSYSQRIKKNEEAIVSLEEALEENKSDIEACNDALNEAKNRISELEAKVENGSGSTLDYSEEIAMINDILDDLSFTTQTLKTDVTNHGKNITSMKNQIQAIEDTINDPKQGSNGYVEVNLADKYYLVVGDNFQLFYRSVIQAVYPYQYYIHVTGSSGHSFVRYFEFKPETAGSYALTISVKDDNGNLLGSDSTTLIVSSNKTARTRNVLCIGDSLTANGQWVARGAGKFELAGGTINTIGTVTQTLSSSTIGISKQMTVNYEGRSGWQWSSYLNSYGETKSPFLINNKLSFKDYVSTNNLLNIDEVYILMTFNGFTSTSTYNFTSSFLLEAKTLVDKIHSDFPDAKITLMSLPLTSTYAGLGSYYSIAGSYGDNYGVHIRIHEYDNFLEEWCNMDNYKSFMRYLDVKGQFDSEYNMPYESKQVNNTNTTKENVGNAMGMHPSSNGYNQIGDVFFRGLMSDW